MGNLKIFKSENLNFNKIFKFVAWPLYLNFSNVVCGRRHISRLGNLLEIFHPYDKFPKFLRKSPNI